MLSLQRMRVKGKVIRAAPYFISCVCVCARVRTQHFEKANMKFVMLVSNSAPTGRIFSNFDIWVLFESLLTSKFN
jgi:hypothetical protein